jgi:hypothetical protein
LPCPDASTPIALRDAATCDIFPDANAKAAAGGACLQPVDPSAFSGSGAAAGCRTKRDILKFAFCRDIAANRQKAERFGLRMTMLRQVLGRLIPIARKLSC